MSSLRITDYSTSSYLLPFPGELSSCTDKICDPNLTTPTPFIASDLSLLNALQMDKIIPRKTALLLKKNLHDHAFTQGTLLKVIYDLSVQHFIGKACFSFLNQKICTNQASVVLEYLYLIMLYKQIAQSHNSVSEEPFHFESTSSYSDKLITRDKAICAKEKRELEKKHRISFLSSWLLQLAVYSTDLAFQREIEILHSSLEESHTQLKPRLLNLFQKMQHLSSPLEGICFKELYEAISKCSEESMLNELYLHIKTEQYYKECYVRVTQLKTSLGSLSAEKLSHLSKKIQHAYNECIFLIQDHIHIPYFSSTRFSAVIGKMRTEWLEINNLCNRVQRQFSLSLGTSQLQNTSSLHLLDNWPLMPPMLLPSALPKLPPISPDSYQHNQTKTIAIMGCNWGGGHKEVARGLADSASRAGYNCVSIDLPEVLIKFDPIHNFCLTRWLKKTWSIGSLFNRLLSSKAYAIINLLRRISTLSKPNPAVEEQKLRQVLEHLLKINPSAVISTYTADNEAIISACKILAIPFIRVATDIDSTIEKRTQPFNYEHLYMALPFHKEECIEPIWKITTESQRIVTGPPVRHAFTLPRTRQDALNFKKKWGIALDKKVIVFTSGKNGCNSAFPALLAKHYATIDNIPVHLIVLTGENNTGFQSYLQESIRPFTKLPMTILSSVSAEDMEELMTMAAYGGGLIGKAGGSTLFEAISRGTRLLCDDIEPGLFGANLTHFLISVVEKVLRLFGFPHQLRWEKANADFGKKYGFVDTVAHLDEFMPKFNKMLDNDNLPVKLDQLKVTNINAEMTHLLERAILKAQTDHKTQHLKEEYQQI